MAVFNEPTQWTHTLGNNADVSTLPDDTSATSGAASLQKLFQLINQTPLEAGGVAPEREDINALYKILGDYIFFLQNGGVPAYNNTYDYVIGRMVLYTDGNIYKCIQANGTSSTVVAPDSVDPVGSNYWVKITTLADLSNFANIDLSNVTAPVQAFKDMSIGWGMPDYSAQISLSLPAVNTFYTYTAPSDGFIRFVKTDNGLNPSNILVNSNPVMMGANTGVNYQSKEGLVPVCKNDIVSYRGGGDDSSYISDQINAFWFIPCKGAN